MLGGKQISGDEGKSGTSEEAETSGLRVGQVGQVKGRKGERKPASFQGLRNLSASGDCGG